MTTKKFTYNQLCCWTTMLNCDRHIATIVELRGSKVIVRLTDMHIRTDDIVDDQKTHCLFMIWQWALHDYTIPRIHQNDSRGEMNGGLL